MTFTEKDLALCEILEFVLKTNFELQKLGTDNQRDYGFQGNECFYRFKRIDTELKKALSDLKTIEHMLTKALTEPSIKGIDKFGEWQWRVKEKHD